MSGKDKNQKSKKIKGYLDMPIGGLILEAGNSAEYKTGEWRTKDFYINKDECSNCLLCFIYCPEKCVRLDNNEISGIDPDYCKGCGICAEECPKNAIEVRLK
ncbi:4Fe-4S binding protein [Actinomycetota bacterium]